LREREVTTSLEVGAHLLGIGAFKESASPLKRDGAPLLEISISEVNSLLNSPLLAINCH
jgi:hypothetical protein